MLIGPRYMYPWTPQWSPEQERAALIRNGVAPKPKPNARRRARNASRKAEKRQHKAQGRKS